MMFPESDWSVIGASVTGTSHLRAGRGCDDAHAYHVLDRDLLLIAVADGAGSAAQSARGAARAVQAAIGAALRILNQDVQPVDRDQWISVLRSILTQSHAALVQLTSERSPGSLATAGTDQSQPDNRAALRDFATTLLVAIVTPQWIVAAQIGDGAMVIQQADGSTMSLTPPFRGEYINETYFLTDTEYLIESDYFVTPCNGIQGIALLTDGLQLLAMNFPENTPHHPFFKSLFNFATGTEANAETLRRFLESERVCARTDDDKTLVLAVRP